MLSTSITDAPQRRNGAHLVDSREFSPLNFMNPKHPMGPIVDLPSKTG